MKPLDKEGAEATRELIDWVFISYTLVFILASIVNIYTIPLGFASFGAFWIFEWFSQTTKYK